MEFVLFYAITILSQEHTDVLNVSLLLSLMTKCKHVSVKMDSMLISMEDVCLIWFHQLNVLRVNSIPHKKVV